MRSVSAIAQTLISLAIAVALITLLVFLWYKDVVAGLKSGRTAASTASTGAVNVAQDTTIIFTPDSGGGDSGGSGGGDAQS
jgi:hypothetical protein